MQDFLANELQNQLERFNNQARFVKMIIDKEIIVANRKKADIMVELRKKNFRPFPKVTKAKAAGETEEVVGADDDDEETTPGATDYDYLLGMAIWSLTKEKVMTGLLVIASVLLMSDVFRSTNFVSKPRIRRKS
jgi:DNA topoisomerase II